MNQTMKRVLLQGVLLLSIGVLGACGAVDEDVAPSLEQGSEVSAATSACCTALPGTSQSFCDSLPQTLDRCNSANGGTSCQWTCGTPCCQALPGTSQSFCNSLPQSQSACNVANGGRSCNWTCAGPRW